MRDALYVRLIRLVLWLTLASVVSAAWSGPAAPSSPGSITIAPASITYFARAGDTLSSIAQQYTSKMENWGALGQLNHIDQDTNIPIGTAILIPAELLADELTEAKVVALTGTITVKKTDGSENAIGIGDKISEGMQIATGKNSFLTVSLPDASRISLPSNSQVKITKLRMTRYTKSPRTEIMLLRGRVESHVSPLEANKGRFEVRSPLSVAGVRGTDFRVGMTEKGIANEVLNGKVAVGKDKSPDTLLLPAGKGNVISAEAVGPAVDLLPAPQLSGYSAEKIYPSVRFSIVPVAGARAYHMQVATDQEMQNILAESYAADSTVRIDGIVDGNYYVRVSAIDKSELEGYANTKPFTLKAGAEPTSTSASRKLSEQAAPSIARSNAKDVTLRWPPQAGKKFKLQIAHNPDFSWLLFTVDTSVPEARIPRPDFGTYYARVQSINADGSTNPFSAAQSFVVTDHWVINQGTPISVEEMQPSTAH